MSFLFERHRGMVAVDSTVFSSWILWHEATFIAWRTRLLIVHLPCIGVGEHVGFR
jgi:hypothetical protein